MSIRTDIWQLVTIHKNKWRNMPDSYWYFRLVEEIGELGASLANDHPHNPEHELKQIASICENWLDKRTNKILEGEKMNN